MDRNRVLLALFLVLSVLAAGVMYGLFRGESFTEFEKSRLYFAAAVLAFLAFIFILSMIFYAFGPDAPAGHAEAAGKAIFDSCVKVIPPIVTLIIGFYFGTYQASTKSSGDVTSRGIATPTAPASGSRQ